jgi:hypothetical protein
MKSAFKIRTRIFIVRRTMIEQERSKKHLCAVVCKANVVQRMDFVSIVSLNRDEAPRQ